VGRTEEFKLPAEEPAPEYWKRVLSKNSSLVTREIADETLVVPISGELAHLQEIFVMNPVAAFIWEHLDGEQTLAAILELVLDHFDVTPEEARADLVDFVRILQEHSLILESSQENPGQG
jgi:methyltransferase-like protein